MLRLDRLLSSTGAISRREAALAVRRGEVSVDGVTVRDPATKIDEKPTAVTIITDRYLRNRHMDTTSYFFGKVSLKKSKERRGEVTRFELSSEVISLVGSERDTAHMGKQTDTATMMILMRKIFNSASGS